VQVTQKTMAEIEIAPLTDRLSEEEIIELANGLEELGAPRLPKAADDSSVTIGDAVDDQVLSEFLDRLEAHDLACEIYLPVEFEGQVEVAELRVGSAPALLEVLEEMKDELSIEEDEDEEDEEEDEVDDEGEILEAKLKHVWKLFWDGATAAVDRHMPLHVQT
jgi:hypothetical protein